MLRELMIALMGVITGLCLTLIMQGTQKTGRRLNVSILRNDIIQYVEDILHHYQQSYGYHNVQYKLAEVKQDVWHHKFLMEKFFLMTGFYGVDESGRVRIRSTLEVRTIEQFLTEVKQGEFDGLISMLENVPAGNFYTHKYEKNPNPV